MPRLESALSRVAERMAQDVAAVEAERKKLDEILGGVPEGVLVTGPDRTPLYANAAFRRLFGIEAEAPTGELLALARQPQVHEALDRAAAGEPGPAVELPIGGREVSVVARRLESLGGTLLQGP